MLSSITLPRKNDTEDSGPTNQREKNMSSYYVDGLLSKSTTGSSLFPNVERASCSIGPRGDDHSSTRTAAAIAFAPSLSGVYSVNNTVYQSHTVFTCGYGQGQDAHSSNCSPFDQSRLFSDSCCHPGTEPLTSSPDKQHRMYPWMQVSGMCCFKAPGSVRLQNIVILRLAVSGSINFVKPLVLHGKNRKTFIAQLMSSAAINSFGQRLCVFSTQRPCRWGFSLHSYYSYSLFSPLWL